MATPQERLNKYSDSASRRILDDIRGAGDSQRNQELNRGAYAMGRLVGAGLLERGTAADDLLDVAVGLGLAKNEARDTVRSGLDSGMSNPADIPEDLRDAARGIVKPPPPPPEKKQPDPAEMLRFWRACGTAESDQDVSAWLSGRGFDPGPKVRAMPENGAAPGWASRWYQSGHRCIVPFCGPDGKLRTVRARAIGDADRKSLAPYGLAFSNCIMVDRIGIGLLQGKAPAADSDLEIWIVEGEPDYLALSTYLDAHPNGIVRAVFGIAGGGRMGSWSQDFADKIPPGSRVVIATDNDATGDKYAKLITGTLRGDGLELFRIPAVLDDAGNPMDLDDRIRAGQFRLGAVDPLEVEADLQKEDPTPPPSDEDQPTDELPEIDAGLQNLPALADQAWAALKKANRPHLFRFGGMPARMETDDQNEIIMRLLDEKRTRHELARAAHWVKHRESKERGPYVVDAMPPRDVVADILGTPNMPLPVLETIVMAPTYTPTGQLHITPGYEKENRTFLVKPRCEIPRVPDHLTNSHIDAARDLLLDELLVDFPFVGDAEIAHALAIFLLPFCRAMIRGPTPLHLIEKPRVGTGASLLADSLLMPSLGTSPTAMTEGKDDDEWRKRLTATLGRGARVIMIDNVNRRIDSAALASAITGTTWEDRILGKSETVRYPIRCGWLATANNPKMSAEIARRTVRIRLDAKVDKPWLPRATPYKHADLRGWVRKHHGDLIWAGCVLVRGWIQSGYQLPPDLQKLGMFESWSEVIGGILYIAGVDGFLSNLNDFYEAADPRGEAIQLFLESWWEDRKSLESKVSDLLEAADGIAGLPISGKSERAKQTSMSYLLRELNDQVFNLEAGVKVQVTKGPQRKKSYVWQLKNPFEIVT